MNTLTHDHCNSANDTKQTQYCKDPIHSIYIKNKVNTTDCRLYSQIRYCTMQARYYQDFDTLNVSPHFDESPYTLRRFLSSASFCAPPGGYSVTIASHPGTHATAQSPSALISQHVTPLSKL